jgi:hypothetical protein
VKLKSYQRAEIVARELRHQLANARSFSELDTARLFQAVSNWMKITGKIVYDRPEIT